MAKAFVLINSEVGAEDELIEKLQKIENVVEVHNVYGVYDVVVKVETDTMENLKNIIHWKIRGIDKVRSSLTMIVMEGKK